MADPRIQQVIEAYGLEPLYPEGGYYARVHDSPSKGESGVPRCSHIYYLMTRQSPSALHRLTSDEIWQFCMGDAARQFLLDPSGSGESLTLGPDPASGQRLSSLVPAGTWQGAGLVPGGSFALFGCTVVPAFSGHSYEHGVLEQLLAEYPGYEGELRIFCREKAGGVPL